MKNTEKKELYAKYRRIAAAYQAIHEDEGGITLIENGVACGWKDELRDPQVERQGTIAVSVTSGRIWEAVGKKGSKFAQRWEERDPQTNLDL